MSDTTGSPVTVEPQHTEPQPNPSGTPAPTPQPAPTNKPIGLPVGQIPQELLDAIADYYTDAVTHTNAFDNTQVKPSLSRLSKDSEAAKMRDDFYGILDPVLLVGIDPQENLWAHKDTIGPRHPWQVHYPDGTAVDVGRLILWLKMAKQYNANAHFGIADGKIAIFSPVAATSQGAPDGAPSNGGGGPLMGGRASDDPVGDSLSAIHLKLNQIIEMLTARGIGKNG